MLESENTPGTYDAWIPVTELADELQCLKQSLFKIITRLNIVTGRRRDTDRGGQSISIVSPLDANRIRAEFIKRKGAGGRDSAGEEMIADDGVFYLIQTEPLLEPGRLKVGFTTDIDGRLQKFRCVAPNVLCVKTWPCRRVWERAAIDCVTAGLERLHTEVFRSSDDSVQEVIKVADKFFALMPKP